MTSKHVFEAGQTVGTYLIVSAAETKSGHARWNVQCQACSKAVTLRGAALAAGAACTCAGKRDAAPTVYEPAWSPITGASQPDDTLAPRVADLEAKLTDLEAKVAALSKTLENLPAAAPKTGIKSYSMAPRASDITRDKLLHGLGTIPEEMVKRRAVLAASWARAWELARLGRRSPEQQEELRARRAVELEDYQFHDQHNVEARAKDYIDQGYCMDKRGPYQPPLED